MWVEIDLDHLLDTERETNSANGIWLWREYWTNKSRAVKSYKSMVDWGNNTGCLFQENWDILDPLGTEIFPSSGPHYWVHNLSPHCGIWDCSVATITHFMEVSASYLVSGCFPEFTFLDSTDFYGSALWMPIWFPALFPIPMYSDFEEIMNIPSDH